MSEELLILASIDNNQEQVLELINKDHVDVNEKDSVSFFSFFLFLDDLGSFEQGGTTAFLYASEYGHLNIMQLLLEKGANPLLKDEVSSFLSFCCYKYYDVLCS